MERIQKLIITFAFVIFFLVMAILNAPILFRQLYSRNLSINNPRSIEAYMTENIPYKHFFSEIYGLTHYPLKLNIIGNFEFFKDDAGLMQKREQYGDPTHFAKEVINLDDILSKHGIPLLYVSLPDRGKAFSFARELDYFGENDKEVLRELEKNDVDFLDLDVNIPLQNEALLKDYFFCADVHLTTQAEMTNALLVTKHLEKRGLEFPSSDSVYNRNSYIWHKYTFWGNLGRSVGRHYSGTDVFETFLPLFNTSFRVSIPQKQIVREGSFTDVMTENYTDERDTLNLYWVTNYGHWPEPVYMYDNLVEINGPRLLVIEDSLSMRATTFLALNASHITVVDPRYCNDMNYLEQAIENEHYDAVILFGSMSLYDYPLIGQGSN